MIMPTPFNEILPGCYPGLSAEEYHAGPGVSKSLLDAFQISPWYYEQAKLGNGKTSSGFDMGTAAHYAVLQPELFEANVICGPEDRRGNKWKDLVAAHPGKTVLTAGDYRNHAGVMPCWRIRGIQFGYGKRRNCLSIGMTSTPAPCPCR